MGFFMCVLSFSLPLHPLYHRQAPELCHHPETNEGKQPITLKCNINRGNKQFLTLVSWKMAPILVASQGERTNKEVIWVSFHLNYHKDVSGLREQSHQDLDVSQTVVFVSVTYLGEYWDRRYFYRSLREIILGTGRVKRIVRIMNVEIWIPHVF